MSRVCIVVAACIGTAVLLFGGPTASAQSTSDWTLVDRMSYEQALHSYQDCGIRKLDLDMFVERRARLEALRVPEGQEGQEGQEATIEVEYSDDFPSDAQAAFARAVDIWEAHISSPVTIRMEARWEPLGSSTLGAAGPFLGLVDTNEDGEGDTIIGFPLLDALTGSDQQAGENDMLARFNSSRSDWHFGEEPAPAGTIDFTSVVLHEIAHGLNYIDLFDYNDSNGEGEYGLDFDENGQLEGEEKSSGPFGRRLIEDQSGGAAFLTNEQVYPNPSQALGDALTNDQVFFDGERANRGAEQGDGPVPPKVYAPSMFQSGSSIAHLAELTYPPESPNALMTPQIGTAETNRDPGPILCGQLYDMGWPLGTGCQQFFREVFALQVQTEEEESGGRTLSWSVGENADVEQYLIDVKYFDEDFETRRQIDASSLKEPEVTLDSLGLGAFAFRLRWERSDGSVRTALETVRDTINVENLTTDQSEADEQGRRAVTFSWREPPGTPERVQYRVERRAGTSGDFIPVTTTDQTSYTANQQTPGRYQYRVTSEDGQGNSLMSASENVEVEFEGDVYALGPYPNPVRETATFDLTAREAQSVTVEVYNTLGQRVYRQDRELDGEVPTAISLNVSEWSSGMYFLRVKGDAGITETEKMLVVQ
ncbi:MAG: T9SS type A sorting domain-containing protein [Salinivenus sp.]